MLDILGLVLPFFGLIFVGYLLARLVRHPIEALSWLNTFVLYLALPALFFQLLAGTPIDQLTEWRFVVGSVFSTYCIFSLMFVGSMLFPRGDIASSTIKGLASAYGNIGYMGPGLALLALGDQAAVPVALIFCFENIMHFAIAPMMMALSGSEKHPPLQVAAGVVRRIVLHPFIIATAAGVLAAALHFEPPLPFERFLEYLARAAAPCALFAMGVTLALRPIRRVPHELLPIALLKLVLHPILVYVMLSALGHFSPVWVYTAVLLAGLPTATNVFVIAQQYHVWVERASASILLTTLFSVGTVTGLVYLIRSGSLPPDLFP
jgi:hypothetical protein